VAVVAVRADQLRAPTSADRASSRWCSGTPAWEATRT
jgi:hypothetical protein